MGEDLIDGIDPVDGGGGRSGHDIDIWGDGSATRSSPIPDWWERGGGDVAADEIRETSDEQRKECSDT
jgi:hypothetical protein